MGRREIAGAEEKIIAATIEVAGNETRGTYSTKEIALRAGLSEFTVFSHFKNKEALISAADEHLFSRYLAKEEELYARYPTDFERFFDGMLSSLLSDPSALRFIASYAPIFPREGEIMTYETMIDKRLRGKANPFLSYLGKGKRSESKDIALLLYCLRESVVDALELLLNVPDTASIRQAMFVLFSQGANAFVKVAE